MELFYNNIALHDLGTLTVGGQQFEPFPPEAPQRKKVILRVRIDTTLEGHSLNRAKISAVLAALETQHAPLLWRDGAVIHVNQTANVAQHNLPDDPNAWGTYHQAIEIAFEYFETLASPNTMPMIFTKTGASAVVLGQVYRWNRRYAAQRYSSLRRQRSGATGGISASGQLVADPALSLAERRASLQILANQMMAAVNGAEGRLVYGGFFDATVRAAEFTAAVDQAADAIDWSLTAEFTEFPNEAGYALAEYEIRTRQSKEDGTYTTVLSGRIGAQSEAAARVKLDTIRAALVAALSAGGPGVSRALRPIDSETRVNHVEADTDGAAFLELNFQETYEGRLDGGDVSARYMLRVQDDLVARLRHTTLSGFIHAHTRANADTALAQLVAAIAVSGNLVSTERTEDRGRYWGRLDSGTDDVAEYLVKLDFANQWVAGLAQADLVLECEVSEEITFSGPRYVIQPTAYGADVVQACGTQSGRRAVTGRVRAASEAAAIAWVHRQYHLPASPGLNALPVTRYRQPPQLALSASFPALVDGVARATTDPLFAPTQPAVVNVPAWEARFSFEEILPTYAFPSSPH